MDEAPVEKRRLTTERERPFAVVGWQHLQGAGRWRYLAAAVLGLLVVGGLIGRVAVPWLLWAYNVERAGQLMSQGLTWPEPRHADTLPRVANREALDQALGHLGAAIRWRPDHSHAYRLAGWIYMARREWIKAAEAFEQARRLAPQHPLADWEAGLAYEQMTRVVATAPAISLATRLAAAPVEAPDLPVGTPFCRSNAPQSCYVGLTTFRLPYAGTGDPTPEEHQVLFLHPPAKVRLALRVPPDRPAVRFLLGLDPRAREWGTDGAVFQLWVEPPAGEARLLFERHVTGEEARAGWVPGWTDLTPWAGQQVTLVFGTAPGPAGDATGDWYGWGDVALTTPEAARYAAFAPLARQRRAWKDGGFDGNALLVRGDEARKAKRYDEALRWYDRALKMDPRAEGAVFYRRGLVFKALEAWDRAETAFRTGTQVWPTNRDLWYELGRVLAQQKRDEEAVEAFLLGVDAPEGEVGASTLLLEICRASQRLRAWEQSLAACEEALARDQFEAEWQRTATLYHHGVALKQLGNLEQAQEVLAEVIRRSPKHYWAYIQRGDALWRLGRQAEGETMLRQAIELRPNEKWAYRALAWFYARDGRREEAVALYRQVLEIDPNDKGAREMLEKLLAGEEP